MVFGIGGAVKPAGALRGNRLKPAGAGGVFALQPLVGSAGLGQPAAIGGDLCIDLGECCIKPSQIRTGLE